MSLTTTPLRTAGELFDSDVCQKIISYLADVGDLLKVASTCRMFCMEVYEVPIWAAVVRHRWGGDIPALNDYLRQHSTGHVDSVDTSLKLKDLCLRGCPRPVYSTILRDVMNVPTGYGVFNADGHTWKVTVSMGETPLVQLRSLNASSSGAASVRYTAVGRCRLIWRGRVPAATAARRQRKYLRAHPEARPEDVPHLSEETLCTRGSRFGVSVSSVDPTAEVSCSGRDLSRIKKRLAENRGQVTFEIRIGNVSASYSAASASHTFAAPAHNLSITTNPNPVQQDGTILPAHFKSRFESVLPDEFAGYAQNDDDDDLQGMDVDSDSDEDDDSSSSASEDSDMDVDDEEEEEEDEQEQDLPRHLRAQRAYERYSRAFYNDTLGAKDDVDVLDYSDIYTERRKTFPGRGATLSGGGDGSNVAATPVAGAVVSSAARGVHDPVHITVHVFTLSTLESDTSLALFASPRKIRLFLNDPISLLASQAGTEATLLRLRWKTSMFTFQVCSFLLWAPF